MEQVEQALHIKIVVTGDAEYDSDYISDRRIHVDIVLENDHYRLATADEVREATQKWMPRGASDDPKPPLFFYKVEKSETPIRAYIPSNKKGAQLKWLSEGSIKTKNTFAWMRAKPNSAKHTLVYVKTNKTATQEAKDNVLVTFAKKWMTCQEQLLEATYGKSALFRYSGWSMAAKYLFREKALQYNPDQISPDEAEWIDAANNGAIIWWAGEYEGHAVQQDCNSFYPSIMTRPEFLVPMKEPSFMELPEDHFDNPDHFPVLGYYRAEIEINDNHFIWRPQINSTYTNYDIIFAQQRGFKIRLIQDNKPNAMLYIGGRVSGKHMFGKYVDELYELKCQKVAGAKEMLNSLWGALCEESKSSKPHLYNVKPNGTKFEIRDGMEVIDFEISGQYEKYTLSHSNKSIAFATPFARIKPFITSAGRLVIANLLHEHQIRS
jgi:hypothetical protein